jgi:hypothetical protein
VAANPQDFEVSGELKPGAYWAWTTDAPSATEPANTQIFFINISTVFLDVDTISRHYL